MHITIKINRIWNWMNELTRYKNGVSNKEVIEHFGEDYRNAWKVLKRKNTSMFYENGKWYRWK